MLENGEKLGAFIVPTGIGASIGGFAGDASYWAREFSKKCKLIVNPNVVNAACFSGINDNMLYVEGYSLDEFFQGKIKLMPSVNNKIGVIFDKSIPQEVLNIHINTINAVKTVYGINVIGYELTSRPVGVEFFVDNSGISTGNVKDLDTIKETAQVLINRGADAIAIVCLFPEDDCENYSKGIGVDPVGGVEAIISHYISKELKIPCAHSPAFKDYEICTEVVNPRASAEYITPTFLPCILLGLNQAPLISKSKGISIENLDFLIVPFSASGSIPVIEMNRLQKKIYSVKENQTVLNVKPTDINIQCKIVKNYSDVLNDII